MKRICTIPNFLSILRILMIPILVLLILRINRSTFPIMILCYFFAIFLDFIDGFLARKLSQESEIGKVLDPVADKLLVLALLLVLAYKTDFPRWLALLIIARDAIILFASAVLYRGKGVVKPSLPVGKVTFALISLTILVYIVDLHDRIDLLNVKQFLVVLCFAFLIWSGIEYWQVFMAEEKSESKAL